MNKYTKENKLVVRHLVKEFLGKGNLNNYEQFIAKNIKVHCPSSWNVLHSHEIEKSDFTKVIDQEYAQAFHFKEMQICDLVAEHDKVFVRWGGEGLHKGNFFSMPLTNRSFSVKGQTLYRLNEMSQVEEVWQMWDLVSVMHKLGFSIAQQNELEKLQKKLQLLSPREQQCLKQLIQGKTSKETGIELGLSHRTIEYYFENIKDKFGCATKRDLFKIGLLLSTHNLL